jgi:hypothetical protein
LIGAAPSPSNSSGSNEAAADLGNSPSTDSIQARAVERHPRREREVKCA